MENSKVINIYCKDKNTSINRVTNPKYADIIIGTNGIIKVPSNEINTEKMENNLIEMMPEILECINKQKEQSIK